MLTFCLYLPLFWEPALRHFDIIFQTHNVSKTLCAVICSSCGLCFVVCDTGKYVVLDPNTHNLEVGFRVRYIPSFTKLSQRRRTAYADDIACKMLVWEQRTIKFTRFHSNRPSLAHAEILSRYIEASGVTPSAHIPACRVTACSH